MMTWNKLERLSLASFFRLSPIEQTIRGQCLHLIYPKQQWAINYKMMISTNKLERFSLASFFRLVPIERTFLGQPLHLICPEEQLRTKMFGGKCCNNIATINVFRALKRLITFAQLSKIFYFFLCHWLSGQISWSVCLCSYRMDFLGTPHLSRCRKENWGTRLERLVRDKHSSLLRKIVNYDRYNF